MPLVIRRNSKFLLLTALVVYFLCGTPPEFGQENLFFQGYPLAKPVIRIALGTNLDEIEIHSSSGMKIYQVDGAYKLLADDADGALVRGSRETLSEKFVVQAAQFRRREDADREVRVLKGKFTQRVSITQDERAGSDGPYQVRIGDFLTRGDALAFIKKINAFGVREAWIIREEVSAAANHPRWVMVNDQLINLNAEAALYFIPSSTESYLTFKGRDFRGIFVLRGSRKGLILVNILNLETYLKGVVPGELPPSYFNEIEAQKAQAIAARTYALKNLGQFDDLGFDLFATPASQVYLGLSAENPLSSRAVDETRGEAIVYGGKLINALYMSTCGGATENVEAMFEGSPVPYLKSTECVLEQDAAWPLKSAAVFPLVFVNGKSVSKELAYLAALDVLPLETDAASWKEPVPSAELAGWVRRAVAKLGKKSDKPVAEPENLTFAGLADLLVGAFDWRQRVQNLMLASETSPILEGIQGVRPEERAAMAYFLISGVYPASGSPLRLNGKPTKAEAAYYLHKVFSSYKEFYGQGSIHSVDGRKIVVREDGGDQEYELGPGLLLFRETDGVAIPAAALDLEAGDVIRWVREGERLRFLQIVAAPVGNELDYSSQFHRWQVRISREDLESRINQNYPIGRLIDIVPGKRGESRRVVEMSIVGQESQVLVKGLKIRQVLNLRDNLFIVDRLFDADGRVASFVFSGKGWGHGVGLCQVGAFRMAQKGVRAEDILKKYYRGVSLEKKY